MALITATSSGKEFEVYIATDKISADYSSDVTGVGTFYTATNWTGAQRMDVEGITLPPFNPTQEFEMRSGSGRIAEFDQIYSSSKRVVTEFTLSGRLTQEVWVILAENVMSDDFDGGTGLDSVLTLASGFTPTNFKHNDQIANATTYSKTLSVYFKAPTANDSYKLSGCVCTSLTVDADMDSASGRFNYSATFQTMYQPTKGSQSVSGASAIGANYLFLSDLTERNIDVKNYSGSTDEDDITPLFKTFSFGIESPTQYLGAQGSNAEPEVFARALPELNMTIGGTVKYDNETDNMIEAFRDPDGLSYLTFYLSDVAVAGETETPTGVFFGASSTAKFGIWAGKCKLTSCEVTSDDLAMVNFEAKVLDAGTGNILHLLGGDNVS